MKNLIKLFIALTLSASMFAQTPAKKPATKPVARGGVASATMDGHIAEPSGPVALKGGKLLTISHGVIDNGVVVIENGTISAVGGANTAIPRNARVIDCTGMTIYPGLIDSSTQLGLTEISAVDMSNDLVEASDEIMPHMHVSDAFHAETDLIPVTRMNGITNAIVVPASRDTLPGQSSMIQLDGKDRDEMLIVRDISLPLNFTGRQRRNDNFATSRYPSTRMGMMAQLRQTFFDAQDYMQKWEDFNKKSSDTSKDAKDKKEPSSPPKRDLRYEALIPYLQGKKPVVLTADEPNDIKTAMRLAKEFNLKVILGQVARGQIMVDEIAASKLPVIVGSIYDIPETNERYDVEYSWPAELAKRGVKIAFASYDSHQVRNLPYAAGYAVAYGLPYEEAMKALTINPAEIWGVSDQLGSLDVGKTANIVVANGDPLDVRTDVKHVFIAGRDVPLVSRQTQLRDEYSK